MSRGPHGRRRSARIVFLHGLESAVDERLRPTGRKARHLRSRYDADAVALDTRVAQRLRRELGEEGFLHPFAGYEEAFAEPLRMARAAIGADTELVIGSSFGAAVLLRLLHEAPGWTGPSLLLAGAGVKLTPYRSLPPGVAAELIHGRQDTVVPLADSELLAASSPTARLTVLDDGHRLASIVEGPLDASIARLLKG